MVEAYNQLIEANKQQVKLMKELGTIFNTQATSDPANATDLKAAAQRLTSGSEELERSIPIMEQLAAARKPLIVDEAKALVIGANFSNEIIKHYSRQDLKLAELEPLLEQLLETTEQVLKSSQLLLKVARQRATSSN